MRTWAVRTDGVYLDAHAVVVAPTEEEALRLVQELLREHLLKTDPAKIDLQEVEPGTAFMQTTGDY